MSDRPPFGIRAFLQRFGPKSSAPTAFVSEEMTLALALVPTAEAGPVNR
jgi:hypothetical protein